MTDQASPTSNRIIRRYGMGSLLAVLSLPIAAFMSALGMNGWQQTAILDMEKDSVALARQGFRMTSSEEHAVPLFGVVYYTATYERSSRGSPSTDADQ